MYRRSTTLIAQTRTAIAASNHRIRESLTSEQRHPMANLTPLRCRRASTRGSALQPAEDWFPAVRAARAMRGAKDSGPQGGMDELVALRAVRAACLGRGMGQQPISQRRCWAVIRTYLGGRGGDAWDMACSPRPRHHHLRGRLQGASEARSGALLPQGWIPACWLHEGRLVGLPDATGSDAVSGEYSLTVSPSHE